MHAMVVVGYGTDFWTLKSDNDAGWGEKGYMRIARKGNRCGVTTRDNESYVAIV